MTADAFWTKPADQVLKELRSSDKGLSAEEAAQRLRSRGVKRKAADFTGIELFINQFNSPLVLLLLFAAGLSFFVQDHIDAIVIMAIVVISGCLGFWQEFGARDAVKKMLAVVQSKTDVLRDGKETEVPVDQVVAGDIIQLSAGATMPGDCLLIETNNMFVDESALTGETFPVEKHTGVVEESAPINKRTNALFLGTHVVSGSAKAIVVHLGEDTEFGKVSQRLRQAAPETDFEHGVRLFGYFLLEVTLMLVFAIFVINVFLHRPILESFMFSLALAVGLTPQLLPAIISVNLAGGARRMGEAKVIVKRLASIESFGSMNILCSDKTGTITEGSVQFLDAIGLDGKPSEKAKLYAYINSSMETGFVNPIDAAIRANAIPGADNYRKLDEVPYDFGRKRLSILAESGGKRVMISKGALQNVLSACTKCESGGTACDIAQAQEQIDDLMKDNSAKGYRVLGLAYKEITSDKIKADDEGNMTLAGLLLFNDPPKQDIAKTLQDLNSLGVSLKIITGDNPLVAHAVAQSIGIKSPQILDSTKMRTLSEPALTAMVNSIDVFADIEPNQKEAIILALKKAGNVVGYIGDGINDASALHAADVGISVNNAVDVAKEAAQLVMLEHNLDVLVQGIREGRRTFANTLKYIFMATSANFGNMFSMAGASLFLPFLPLLPKQILLTNLMTDFPEMAIVTDSVDAELVEKPGRWNIRFIRKFMVVFGTISSVFDYITFAVLLMIFHAAPRQFRTAWFTESVISACLIVLVLRTRKPFVLSRPSKPLAVANLAVIAAILVLPYTPLAPFLEFEPLPPAILVAMAIIIVLYVLSTELAKKFFYSKVRS